MVTCYIVIDKKTKKYIPQVNSKSKSRTNTELTDKLPPRLFKSKAAAQQSIRWWKSGRWGMYSSSGYMEPPDWYLDVIRAPEREKIELVIRPLTIDNDKLLNREYK